MKETVNSDYGHLWQDRRDGAILAGVKGEDVA